MAAVRFNVAVTETGLLKPPTLTQTQLTEIGQRMVLGQKARWAAGINTDDQRAAPLKKKTAQIKRKYKGQTHPIRDMDMTGLVKRNFTLRKATMTMIRAENTSNEGRRRARVAQRFESMIGLSPSEERAVFQHAYSAYRQYVNQAWVPKRG